MVLQTLNDFSKHELHPESIIKTELDYTLELRNNLTP